MVSGAEHAAVAGLRAGEWKCALLVRRSVADAWSLWEIAPQPIDILESVRQPLPDERRSVDPSKTSHYHNKQQVWKLYIARRLAPSGRENDGDGGFLKSQLRFKLPTQLPTHGRIFGV